MNDWPPPTPEQIVPTSRSAGTSWVRLPVVQVLIVIWVLAGLVAMVVLAVGSLTDDPEVTASIPNATSDTTTSRTAGSDATADNRPDDAVATSEPQVRSAPPVPPPVIETVPSAANTADGTPPTTIVVTLPSSTLPAGATGSEPPTIEVTTRFDAVGDDPANLNGEWVRFTNGGTQSVDLTSWIVRDDGLVHAHVFETLTLAPGAAVTLYSGCGTATTTERFFCTSNAEVWNNDGDVVSLFDDRGVLVVQVTS